jgi:hypothetical protein
MAEPDDVRVVASAPGGGDRRVSIATVLVVVAALLVGLLKTATKFVAATTAPARVLA